MWRAGRVRRVVNVRGTWWRRIVTFKLVPDPTLAVAFLALGYLQIIDPLPFRSARDADIDHDTRLLPKKLASGCLLKRAVDRETWCDNFITSWPINSHQTLNIQSKQLEPL